MNFRPGSIAFSLFTLILLAGNVLAQQCTEPSFHAAQNFGHGLTDPLRFAMADFNKDGRQDFAVAGRNINFGRSERIAVLLGNEGGTFRTSVVLPYTTGIVGAGDFNGDGNPDIVLSSLRFFYGDGAGNFNGPFDLPITLDSDPEVFIADFNADGRSDLYYLNATGFFSGLVVISNSSGGFTQIAGPPIARPNSMSFADFNGDSKMDFVSVDNTGILVSLGDGAGHFTPQTRATASPNFLGLGNPVVSDFNHDGKLDVVVNRTSSFRTFFPGDGTGNFGSPVSEQTTSVVKLIADFNNDGKMDIAGGPQFGESLFVVSLGDGTGHFADSSLKAIGGVSTGLAVSDFNGDGKLDLASNNPFGGDISVVFGDGTGNFDAAEYYPAGNTGARSIAVGDFNGDAKTDFTAIEPVGNRLQIYHGNGSGSFSRQTPVEMPFQPSYLESGDFNHDGKTDLIVLNNFANWVTVTFGGNLGLQSRMISFIGPTFVDTGDVNGDNQLDFVVMNTGSYATVLGDGAGNFTASPPVNTATTATSSLELADFTGDGKLDLAVVHESPIVSILVGNGSGSFTPTSTVNINSNFNQARTLVSADFNADSKMDLAVANKDGGDVQVFFGNGNATFGAPVSYADADEPRQVIATDINLDNRPDLVLLNTDNSSVSIFVNDGNGGFLQRLNYGVAADSRKVAVSDFNSDGKPDLAAGSEAQDGVVVLLSAACNSPDLTVSKSHDGNFAVGINAVYEIGVTNTDFARTLGTTTVSDLLPPGLSFVSATGTGWQCSAVGQQVTCTHDAPIEKGERREITLTVTPSAAAVPGVTNVVTVSHLLDGNHDNDSASDATIVNNGVSITGRAVDRSGNGLTGVTMVLRGVVNQTTTTTANGSYSFSGLPEGFTYTVAPSKTALFFSPASRVFRNLYGGGSGDFVGRSQTNGKIVFSRNVAGQVKLWTMNPDGSNQTQLTSGSGADTKPQWSPDGSMIVFQRGSSFNARLWVMNADGGNERQLTATEGNSPVWSPDGRTIAYTKETGSGVFAINIDGTNNRTIFNSAGVFNPLSWSPDGTSIAYTRQPLMPNLPPPGFHLYTMDPDGLSQKVIINNPGRQDIEPDYSPDGLKLVYLTYDGNVTYDLATANSDGTGEVRLGRVETVSNPSWSPDGTKIVFVQNQTIQISNSDGTGRVSLPGGGIHDNDPDWQPIRATGPSQIDDAEFFVRQHYQDFLNRTPDPAGLAFWKNEITSCGSDQQCIALKRVNVSAAFFLSIEFRQTGYFVERIYKSAYGDGSGTSTLGGSHTLPVPIVRLNEFLPDTQQIGQGVVVGESGWEALLANNKQLFVAQFVERQRFKDAYPVTMSAQEFVDTLDTRAGRPLSQSERNQLIAELTSGAKTRAQVVQVIAEDADLVAAEFNRAFVLMQYFGYLRRNPNDPQDSDYTGYDFWLSKLNQFNGNFIAAEMVKAFITSGEYRGRF